MENTETNNAPDVIGHVYTLTQLAAQRWHAAFDKLDRDKAETVRLITHAFNFAMDAYMAAQSKTLDDTNRIITAGSFAYYYSQVFDEICRRLNCDPVAAIEKMQSTSDYLGRKGWITIPSFLDDKGYRVTKTAHGMHKEMARFREMALTIRAGLHGTDEERRVPRSKKREDKSPVGNSDGSDAILGAFVMGRDN